MPAWLVAEAAARRWFRHYNLKLPNANDNAYQSQHTHTNRRSKRADWQAAVLRGVAQWDAVRHIGIGRPAGGQWNNCSAQFAVNELVI